jgi:hypothetical protein
MAGDSAQAPSPPPSPGRKGSKTLGSRSELNHVPLVSLDGATLVKISWVIGIGDTPWQMNR